MASQPSGAGAELGAHDVVELADAPETRREGYLTQLPIGVVHEHPGGVGPAGPVDLVNRGPHFFPEDPVQLPHTDTESFAQPCHTEIVNPVTDGLHYATDQVLPPAPAHLAGEAIGPASPARPETGGNRGGRTNEESTVLAAGQPGGAGGTAVDAR